MTDPMIPGPPMPAPLPVQPGDAERALGRVRARRRRSAVLASSFVVVAVATGVVVSAGAGGQSDSIGLVSDDKRPLVESSSPSPSMPAVASSPGPRATAAVTPTSHPDPAPSPIVSPPAIGSPEPDRSTRPAPAPRPGYRRRPAVHRVTEQGVVHPNQGHVGGCVGAPEWCAVVGATSKDEGLHFRFIVCRETKSGARLTFETDAEMDVAVRDAAGREIWRWSAGQAFRKVAHDLDVPAGACVIWSMTWDAVLDSGKPIPRGEYELVGSSLATETRLLRADSSFTVR